MLAGIIPAPSSWDPAVNQEQAEKRYDRVLSIMKEDGYITAQEKKEAQFPAVAEIQQSNQMERVSADHGEERTGQFQGVHRR